MKSIIYILLIISFNVKATGVVNITSDTVVSNTWNLQGKLLRMSATITGGGTIQNAIIEANPFIQIFDTTITLVNCQMREVSARWFGARTNKADNYFQLQWGIDMAIANNCKNFYIPSGGYSYANPLKVKKYNATDNTWSQVGLNVYGEADMWNDATVLNYTLTTGFAFGFQHAKGGSISHLKITGRWQPPVKVIPAYYSLPETSFTDRNGLCPYGNYRGLVIDWDATRGTSGSTAIKINDMYITGFDVLYCISPNGRTQNADILMFENIQCGDGRRGIESNQPQEKGNRIINITSWGMIHTLINIGVGNGGAGNYIIEGGNVAGSCIRLFNIDQRGWFSTYISNIYAESIGQVGVLSSSDLTYKVPLIISNCIFEFAMQSEAGKQVLVTANSYEITFDGCTFRYFGNPSDTMQFYGYANYINTKRSGQTRGMNNSFNLNYPIPPFIIPQPSIKIKKQ